MYIDDVVCGIQYMSFKNVMDIHVLTFIILCCIVAYYTM